MNLAQTTGTIVRLAAAITLLSSIAHPADAQETKRPNIVVILADDLGFSDIGCYGGEIATPNLDGLARRGVRFTEFYNAARCCPSRAALLTGLYPHQAGVGDMVDAYAAKQRERLASPAYTDRLRPEVPTLAELLRAGGYRTLMVGKWHLGYRPNEGPAARGFDRSFALIEGAMNYYGHGIQHTKKIADPPMALDGEPFVPPRDGFFATDAFTDHAVRLVREQKRDAPFFLYLAYTAPHWPLHAHAEDIARYRGKFSAGWDQLAEKRLARLKERGILPTNAARAPRPGDVPAWDSMSAKDRAFWEERFAVYAAQVEELDRGIGRVVTAIREAGHDRNTVVMFLSDNGGAAERPSLSEAGAAIGSRTSYEGYGTQWAWLSCTPFRRYKRFVSEGGISTPCIIAWPAGIAESRQSKLIHGPAHLIDLLPTCLELASVKHTGQWKDRAVPAPEGETLLPALRTGEVHRKVPLYWEHEGNRAVRRDHFKLVAEYGKSWQLYDLREDRAEQHDLAERFPQTVREMVDLYDAWARRCGVESWSKALGKN